MENKEIDKLIAEKVMELVICHTAETWADKSESWWCDKERYEAGEQRIKGPNGMGVCRADIWHPTESIEQAWMVVDKMTNDELYFQITSVHGYGYEVTVFKSNLEQQKKHGLKNELVTEFAGTAPVAICRAALKAVGIEIT